MNDNPLLGLSLEESINPEKKEQFIKRILAQHPELIKQAQAQDKNQNQSSIHKGKNYSFLLKLLEQLWVKPKDLYGTALVTNNLVAKAKQTAELATVNNVFNAGTTAPFLLLSLKEIPILGPILATISTLLIVVLGNKVATASVDTSNKLAARTAITCFIGCNVFQSLISGVGMELFLNQQQLADLQAQSLTYQLITQPLEEELKQKQQALQNDPLLLEYKQRSQELKAKLEETQGGTTEHNKVFVQCYGTWEQYLNRGKNINLDSPIASLPDCIAYDVILGRLNRAEQEAETKLNQHLNAISKHGGHRNYLSANNPEIFSQYFNGKGYLIGLEAVKVAIEHFKHKLMTGQYSALGMSFFGFALSTLMSLSATLLLISYALSEEVRNSNDPKIYRRKAQFWAEIYDYLNSQDDDSEEVDHEKL